MLFTLNNAMYIASSTIVYCQFKVLKNSISVCVNVEYDPDVSPTRYCGCGCQYLLCLCATGADIRPISDTYIYIHTVRCHLRLPAAQLHFNSHHHTRTSIFMNYSWLCIYAHCLTDLLMRSNSLHILFHVLSLTKYLI